MDTSAADQCESNIKSRLRKTQTATTFFQSSWSDEDVDDSDRDENYAPPQTCSKAGSDLVMRGFVTKGIKRHIPKQRPSVLKCTHCNAEFFTESMRSAHVEATHPQLLQCSQCDKKCNTRSNLYSHVRHQHMKHRFLCPADDCQKSFAFHSELDNHVSVHKESLIFRCPCKPCSSVCSTAKALKAHMRRQHTHVQKYQCDKCSFVCENPASMSNHTKSKHGDGWSCALCFKHFTLQTSYYRHCRKCVGLKGENAACAFPMMP